jgi:hypothetical protein
MPGTLHGNKSGTTAAPLSHHQYCAAHCTETAPHVRYETLCDVELSRLVWVLSDELCLVLIAPHWHLHEGGGHVDRVRFGALHCSVRRQQQHTVLQCASAGVRLTRMPVACCDLAWPEGRCGVLHPPEENVVTVTAIVDTVAGRAARLPCSMYSPWSCPSAAG